MKGNPLRELDEPSAALRILLLFLNAGQGINITKLYEAMETFGVGRTAVDSSRRALIKAGLAGEQKLKGETVRTLTILFPTSLGFEVARKLQEIREIMDRASSGPSP
jgi:hypothetical protein